MAIMQARLTAGMGETPTLIPVVAQQRLNNPKPVGYTRPTQEAPANPAVAQAGPGTPLIHPNITPAAITPTVDSGYSSSIGQQEAIAQAAQARLQAQQQEELQARLALIQSQPQPVIGNVASPVGSTVPTSASYSAPIPGGGIDNPADFARAILHGLGDPTNKTDMSALERWIAQEGGNWHNDAHFNPLNTTQSMPGYSETGTQGNIGSYTDWKQGLAATLKTLENGRYGSILSALKQGQSVGDILGAISASPWGTKF